MKKLLLAIALLALVSVAYAATLDVKISFTRQVDSGDVRLAKLALATDHPSAGYTVKSYCQEKSEQACDRAFNGLVRRGWQLRKAAKLAEVKALLVDGLPSAQ